METILEIFLGSVACSGIVTWLLRNWISVRLKKSIAYEYSHKLENHKNELNSRIQAMQHEYQLNQLRTSLFFDHQRLAFATLLSKLAEVNQQWIMNEYSTEEGFTGPVPNESYQELRKLYYEHQLFLDTTCLAAMDLIFECYADGMPFDDGSGEKPQIRNADGAYNGVEYLQPRLAELFQYKIGVAINDHVIREIALFGAIKLVNNYHSLVVKIEPTSPLKLTYRDHPEDAVIKAESNIEELLKYLTLLREYFHKDGGGFHQTSSKVDRYLTMLTSTNP